MSEPLNIMTVSIETPNGLEDNKNNPHEYYKDAYANIVTHDGIIVHSYIYVDPDGLALYQVPNPNVFGHSFDRRPYDALMAIRAGYANDIIGDNWLCSFSINFF